MTVIVVVCVCVGGGGVGVGGGDVGVGVIGIDDVPVSLHLPIVFKQEGYRCLTPIWMLVNRVLACLIKK